MNELVRLAIEKGAKVYWSVSGGKDGQAGAKSWFDNGYRCDGLIHADLGRVEWPESMGMCERLAKEIYVPLHVVTRTDKRDLLDHWKHRMNQLKIKETNTVTFLPSGNTYTAKPKPFWSSSKNRYCTSDLKRGPINNFLTSCGKGIIISCEGIRAQESAARAKKVPLEIRWTITSSYYNGMTVEEAINAFVPGKRLALTYYPIFHYSLADVWATYGADNGMLEAARYQYRMFKSVPTWWLFHPAYVYGNERVSCMFCVLGCGNDLKVAAKHNPGLLNEMIGMEEEGQATFKNRWSLKELL